MIYQPSIFDTKKNIDVFFHALDMKWPEHFGEYSRFYNIATKSIKDYIDYLEFKNGNALTIFASAEQGQTILNYNLYKKICNKLPVQIKLFWDTIYEYFNYNNDAIAYYLFRSLKEHSKKS